MRSDPEAGVFETLLVVNGVVLELAWHVERLAASVSALYGRAWTLPELPDVGAGRCRLRVTVRPQGSGLVTRVERSAVDGSVDLGLAPPARLAPVEAPGGLGPHKWRDRSWLERQPPEPLLVDAGTVLEAGRGSVFLVEDGRLVTPPLDGRILPGVTRRRLLELAPAAEEPVTTERLLAAGEVFLTGSIRGVEPVAACAARSWSAWPVARELGRRLGDVWLGQAGLARRQIS